MKNKLRTLLAGATLALGALGATVVAQPATTDDDIVGTIEVPFGARFLGGLEERATVTGEEATAAAQEALDLTETPTETELEVEDGYLVWEVEFPDQDVLVDAGSGEVLRIEADDDGERAGGADDN